VKSILLHKSILLVFPKEKSESLARRGFSFLKIIHSFMCTPGFGENLYRFAINKKPGFGEN